MTILNHLILYILLKEIEANSQWKAKTELVTDAQCSSDPHVGPAQKTKATRSKLTAICELWESAKPLLGKPPGEKNTRHYAYIIQIVDPDSAASGFPTIPIL